MAPPYARRARSPRCPLRPVQPFAFVFWIGGIASCITPSQFQALERDVEQLKRQGGPAPGRVHAIDQEIARLRAELSAMRAELGEVRHLAERAHAPSIAVMLPRAEEGRSGELSLIPRALAAPVPSREASSDARADREVEEYEAAFRLYRDGDYSAAVKSFRAFLRSYPESSYADNALFWSGECHQKLGDLVLAAVTFERVHKQFPKGNKVPDALYRQAIALLEIGRRRGEPMSYQSAAREVLQRIADEFPRSERAEEARRLLEKLS